LPPGAMKREQVDQLAAAAKNDPVIKPYRSFCNLTDGKIVCVMEAPDKLALAEWFKKMKVPCDFITPVELEGERGAVKKRSSLVTGFWRGHTFCGISTPRTPWDGNAWPAPSATLPPWAVLPAAFC